MQQSTIMEKNVGTLCLILGEKVTPLSISPNAMLIEVMMSEALPDPPTLIDEAQKDYDKNGN